MVADPRAAARVRLLGDLRRALRGLVAGAVPNEEVLHNDVQSCLLSAGFTINREVIDGDGRYDLLAEVDGLRVAVEIKVAGSAAALCRQVQRYLGKVDAVFVVTTRADHLGTVSRCLGHRLDGTAVDGVVVRAL